MAWSNSAPRGVTFGSESSKTTGNSYNNWKATVYYSQARVGVTVYFRFRIVWDAGPNGTSSYYPYAHNSISIGGRNSNLSGDIASPSRGSTTYRYYSYTNAAANSITWGLGGSSSSAGSQGSYYTLATTVSVSAATSYTIRYNGNGADGGSTASQTKYKDVSISLRSNGFTRTGYHFLRWNTNSAGTGTAYAEGAGYTTNAALTLYAVWKKKAGAKMRVKAGGNWYAGKVFVKVGGAWIEGKRVYAKKDGAWGVSG